MKPHLMTLPILLFVLSGTAVGYDVSYREIKGELFSTIRKITLCGNYHAGNNVGEVRLIESYTYGGNMLFLDTVKLGDTGLVEHTHASIQETNNDHSELEIENVSCKDLGNNHIQIKGQVTGSGHDDTLAYPFQIIYNAHTGEYQYNTQEF